MIGLKSLETDLLLSEKITIFSKAKFAEKFWKVSMVSVPKTGCRWKGSTVHMVTAAKIVIVVTCQQIIKIKKYQTKQDASTVEEFLEWWPSWKGHFNENHFQVSIWLNSWLIKLVQDTHSLTLSFTHSLTHILLVWYNVYRAMRIKKKVQVKILKRGL